MCSRKLKNKPIVSFSSFLRPAHMERKQFWGGKQEGKLGLCIYIFIYTHIFIIIITMRCESPYSASVDNECFILKTIQNRIFFQTVHQRELKAVNHNSLPKIEENKRKTRDINS